MLYLYVHIANINHLILPYNQLEHTKLKNRWQMNISDHFPTRIVIKIRELIGIRSNLKIKCDLLTHKIQIWRPNSKLRWSKDKLFVVFAVFFPLLQSSRCAHNSLINVKAYVCIKFMCILTKKITRSYLTINTNTQNWKIAGKWILPITMILLFNWIYKWYWFE